jgi:hypothetical protein
MGVEFARAIAKPAFGGCGGASAVNDATFGAHRTRSLYQSADQIELQFGQLNYFNGLGGDLTPVCSRV